MTYEDGTANGEVIGEILGDPTPSSESTGNTRGFHVRVLRLLPFVGEGDGLATGVLLRRAELISAP